MCKMYIYLEKYGNIMSCYTKYQKGEKVKMREKTGKNQKIIG